MTSRPLVSICVPVFNRARYISEALDSAAADRYRPKEIVVLDDGSTDGSAAEVERWIDAHPGVAVRFERRPHLGIPAACNRLVELARGEMIAWLGSDDRLIDGGLAARAAYLESNPGKQAVFADAQVIDGDGRLLHDSVYGGLRKVDKRRFAEEASLRRTLIARWCVPQPVLMVRRGVYDLVGAYDESFVVEDYDFYLRLLSREALGFLDVPVAEYRVHDGNFCWHRATRLPMMRQFWRASLKNRPAFRWPDQAALLAFGAAAAVKAAALDAMHRWRVIRA